MDILFPPLGDVSGLPPVSAAPVQEDVVVDDGDIFDESLLNEFVAGDEEDFDQDFDDQFDISNPVSEQPASSSSNFIEPKPDPVEEDSLNRSVDSQRSVSLEFRLDRSGNAVAVVRSDPNPAASSSSLQPPPAEPVFDDAIQPVLDSLQEEFHSIERSYMTIYAAKILLSERADGEMTQNLLDIQQIVEDIDDARIRCTVIGFIKPDSFITLGGHVLERERAELNDDESESASAPPLSSSAALAPTTELSISEDDVDVKGPAPKRARLTDGGIAAAAADAARVQAEADAVAGRRRRIRAKPEPKREILPLANNAKIPTHPPGAKKVSAKVAASSPIRKLARKLGYKPSPSSNRKSTNIL